MEGDTGVIMGPTGILKNLKIPTPPLTSFPQNVKYRSSPPSYVKNTPGECIK